jgi:uncharacterized membrane protein
MLALKNKTVANSFIRILIVLLIPATLYFLITHAFPRLYFTQENYGDYYWPRRFWLLTHVVCGIFATLAGPFQFVPRIRNRHWMLHRNLGKAYLLCVLISAVAAIYLAFTSTITPWYTYGLVAGSIAWLFTGASAYIHIRNKRTRQHKEMMIRNYVVTFFFIIFFGIYDLLVATGTDAYDAQMLSILPWACLLIPLGIAEYFIQLKAKSKKQ